MEEGLRNARGSTLGSRLVGVRIQPGGCERGHRLVTVKIIRSNLYEARPLHSQLGGLRMENGTHLHTARPHILFHLHLLLGASSFWFFFAQAVTGTNTKVAWIANQSMILKKQSQDLQ